MLNKHRQKSDVFTKVKSLFLTSKFFRMYRFLLFLIPFFLIAKEPDFGNYEGSAVIADLNNSVTHSFGTFTHERLHPCSTFKILNSLIALDADVVKDENEIITWDGVKRTYDFWNKDHSMRSAIAVSAVWVYQEFAKRIGQELMQKKVLETNYGNNDTSQTLTDFWLGTGSLMISAHEQVSFLQKLIDETLPFSKRAMLRVKEILIVQQDEQRILAGKTGSCGGVGWFVGYSADKNKTEVFAFVLKGDNATGVEAKRVALDYFQK